MLVAGGLGERLGYSGIKLALPTETTTGTPYLEHYLKYLVALQAKRKSPMHLAIMVSDDTHDRTAALLEEKGYFGFSRAQLTLMKQEKVAALLDNDARIARVEGETYAVECKPHGHGDVHSLLHSTGMVVWEGVEADGCVVALRLPGFLPFNSTRAASGGRPGEEMARDGQALAGLLSGHQRAGLPLAPRRARRQQGPRPGGELPRHPARAQASHRGHHQVRSSLVGVVFSSIDRTTSPPHFAD